MNYLWNKANNIRRITIFLIFIGFIVFLYFFNQVNKIELINQQGTGFEKAVVEEVVTDNLQSDGTRVGNQQIKVKILSGELNGKILDATSTSGYLYGADCKKGMRVIVSVSTSNNNSTVAVYSFDREPIIYGFIAIFIIILCIIGGMKGFKSAISLIFTFICILFLFIPMIYKGYSPFLSAIIVGILTTIVTMYMIAGVSIKSVSAVIGTVLGVIISAGVAAIFGHFAKISGFNVSEVEDLAYLGTNAGIDIGGLLFAGILISSLGAVMDICMSVASTIFEMNDKNPKLKSKELFISGLNVGRDMMGTMANTLILAFTGGTVNTLILIYAYDMRYNQVMNMYSVGIEIMQGVSGSIGVVLSVPLVAFITSKMIHICKKNN